MPTAPSSNMDSYESIANLAVVEVSDRFLETWYERHPLWDMAKKEVKTQRVVGPAFRMGIGEDAPGQVTELYDGNEPLNQGYREGVKAVHEAPMTCIYSFTIPRERLRNCEDDKAVAKYTARRTKAGLEDFVLRLARQQVMGGSVQNYTTFNGDASYVTSLGTRGGLISFQDADVQTGDLHGIQRRTGAKGWVNQHRHITSLATDLGDTLMHVDQDIIDSAVQSFADDRTMMFSDGLSFRRITKALNAPVLALEMEAPPKLRYPGHGLMRKGIVMQMDGGTLYWDPQIKIADYTTTDAQEGVILGINPSSMLALGRTKKPNLQGADEGGRSPFDMWIDRPRDGWDRDVLQVRIYFNGGIMVNDPRKLFSITGAANS